MTREEAIKFAEHAVNMTNIPEVKEFYRMFAAALRPVSREQLSEFKTCDLVDELRKREGVETHIAEPYQDVTVSVNGPAVVLVVID